MYRFNHFQPVSRELMIKISILKTMMYCGVLWGLYHQGWAIKSDQDGHVFWQAWVHHQAERNDSQDYRQDEANCVGLHAAVVGAVGMCVSHYKVPIR